MTITSKSMKQTRRMHRNILRSAESDDLQSMRTELNALYDPDTSALTNLTEGPCKVCMTPLVDAVLLSSFKKRNATCEESMDNIQSIGKTFQMSVDDITNVRAAAHAARICGEATDPSARRSAYNDMSSYLNNAGFSDAGLCIPDAIGSNM